MKGRARFRRLVSTSVCAVVLLLALAPRALAQEKFDDGDEPSDSTPPIVTITPASGTWEYPGPISVTIDWCDETDLEGNTREIKLNNVDVTDDFTYEWLGKDACWATAKSEGEIMLQGGSNTLSASISDGHNTGSGFAGYTYDTEAPPYIAAAVTENGDILSAGMCAGCFDKTFSYTTAPYISMDAPQSVTLFYSSWQAKPFGWVAFDAWNLPENTNPPDKMSISLKRPDGTFVSLLPNADTAVYHWYPQSNDTIRLTALFDASDLPTGAYGYTAVIRSWWNDTTFEESSQQVRVLIQNEKDSPVFPGWTIAGDQTLIEQGDSLLVLVDGAGTILAFDEVSTDVYEAPRADFTRIERTSGSNYVRLWPDSTKAYFGVQYGRIAVDSIVDRFGNKTINWYDAEGRLTAVTGPMGKVTELHYSGTWDGLYSVVDPNSRITYFTGSTSTDDLLSIQDPDGNSARAFTYDADHRILSSTDREGATTDYSYDRIGRLDSLQLAQVQLFDGSNVRPLIGLTSPEDRAVPPAGVGTFTSPGDSLPPDSVYGSTTGPRGGLTKSWFNGFGQPVKIVDPVGRTTTASYNGHGQRGVLVTPGGKRVETNFSEDRLILHRIVGLRETDYTYESTYGLLKEVWVQDELKSTRYYDSEGRLDSTRIGNAPEVTTHHSDARGRDTLVVDPEGHQTVYRYDSTWGNLKEVVEDGGQTTTVADFDGWGRIWKTVTPTGDTTIINHDLMNRVKAVWDPENAEPTRTHYGPIYVDSITNPKGERHRFVHNALGWVTEEYGPASATVADQYGYDAAGNLVRWTNRNGEQIDYTVDLLGRTTRISAPDRTLDYGYDPSGQDKYVWGANTWSTDTTWFTTEGFVDSTKAVRSSGSYVVDYEYGHWTGRPTAMHDRHNNRTLGFRYNDQGQLDSLIVRGRTTWTSVRNADLQTTRRIYPAEFEQTFEYSGVHRRAEIDYSGIVTRNYGFDAADRIESVDDGDLHTYAYDGLGQLLEHETYDMSGSCTYSPYYPYMDCSGVDTTLVATESFSYDPVGNRTDGNAQIDPGSRLTSIDLAEGTLTYSYDAAGNVTQREISGQGLVQDLYWNALGRPDSIVTSDGSGTTTSVYRYDAFGRRIRVEEGGSAVESVWAMGHVLFDIEGTTVTEYAYLPGTDRLHSMYRNGEFHYYLTDYLGSVVAVVDSSGVVRNSYDYDVWGDEISSSEQLENRFGFAGREYDRETGFYYIRARFYDPLTGRFLSEDPIGLAGGLNPYRYAGNNSISLRDPTGLCHDDDHQPPGSGCSPYPLPAVEVEVERCDRECQRINAMMTRELQILYATYQRAYNERGLESVELRNRIHDIAILSDREYDRVIEVADVLHGEDASFARLVLYQYAAQGRIATILAWPGKVGAVHHAEMLLFNPGVYGLGNTRFGHFVTHEIGHAIAHALGLKVAPGRLDHVADSLAERAYGDGYIPPP